MVKFYFVTVPLLVLLSHISADQRPVKSCDDPGIPNNGSRKDDEFHVEYFCDQGFKLAKGSQVRVCQESGKWSGEMPICEDIDECSTYTGNIDEGSDDFNDVQSHETSPFCHEKAKCVNTIGSFRCDCVAGYYGNGKICLPTNFNEEELLQKSKRRNKLHACGTIVTNNTARHRRIVGGKQARHGAWPWQAAIFYKNIGRRYLFNGAFIKPRWVLTVANALKRNGIPVKPRKLQITLGEHNRERLDGTERYVRVKRIIIHPKYDRHTLSNNIALLELAKPVKPNSHIRTVCIPRKKRDAILERPPYRGYVAGWGSSKKIRLGESTGPLSATLKQVDAPLVSDKICKRSTIYKYDHTNYFCAGYRKKARAPCFSDVGSPLVVLSPKTGRWVVLGLFGWSEGCGQANKYAYYTRVTRYRRWILSVIHKYH